MGKRAAAVSDKRANRLKNVAGMHAMGEPAGLYLLVDSHGGASWILRYMLDGRRRDMGLGSASDFTLTEARELARVQRKLIAQGVDPVEARREVKLARQRDQAKVLTFRQCCAKYLSAHSDEWSNA